MLGGNEPIYMRHAEPVRVLRALLHHGSVRNENADFGKLLPPSPTPAACPAAGGGCPGNVLQTLLVKHKRVSLGCNPNPGPKRGQVIDGAVWGVSPGCPPLGPTTTVEPLGLAPASVATSSLQLPG